MELRRSDKAVTTQGAELAHFFDGLAGSGSAACQGIRFQRANVADPVSAP